MTQQQTSALARTGSTQLAANGVAHHSADAVTRMLEDAATKYHLLSPAAACVHLPEGFSVSTALVRVSADAKLGDVYPIPGSGKLGLGKAVLNRLSMAAGISWDPAASGRRDDGQTPYFWHYKAVGVRRHFDGREIMFEDEKIVDLRDGSPAVREIFDRAAAKKKNDARAPVNPEAELRAQRLHGYANCVTKAKLRALRAGLGLQTSYSAEELKKPFCVAFVMFSGVSEDPTLRRAFALMAAQNAMSATRMLYGPREAERTSPQLPALSAAPPVGAASLDVEDYEVRNEAPPFVDPPRTRVADAPPPPTAAPPAASETAKPAKPSEPGALSGFVLPGGPKRGTAIESAATKDVEYWIARITTAIEEQSSRDPDADAKWLAAARAELDRRDTK